MTENGEERPIIEPGHVLDAFIVAGIVFFSVLGGDAVISITGGEQVLLTVNQVVSRAITGVIAFGMTFFAQWARYRGIKLSTPVTLGDNATSKESDDD